MPPPPLECTTDSRLESFVTEPHGQHEIKLVEDHAMPQSRIYALGDRLDHSVLHLLGSELDSLLTWWSQEKRRNA